MLLGIIMRGILVFFVIVILVAGSVLLAQDTLEGTFYFEEEFEDGIPENWPISGIWERGDSLVSSENDGGIVVVPGEWSDFSLAMRLRNLGPGVRSVVFRASTDQAYTVDFRPEGIGLHRRDENRVTTWLDWGAGGE